MTSLVSDPSFFPADLFTISPEKILFLSPSDRARRAYERAWVQQSLARGSANSLVLPKFETIENFAVTIWEEGQLFGVINDERALLSPLVEASLWLHIAAETSQSSAAERGALARGFAEAWTLEHQYAPADDGAITATRSHAATASNPANLAFGANGEMYAAARRRFIAMLRDHRAISRAELFLALTRSAESNSAASALKIDQQHLVLTHRFIGATSEKNFFSKLNEFNVVAQSNWRSTDLADYAKTRGLERSQPPRRVAFSNEAKEMRAAIAWAKSRLEASTAVGTVALPFAAQIAIVVPNLQRVRGTWIRALNDAGVDYNVSLGLPLSKHPWAAVGFTLVSALFRALPPETISAALRHPRWGRSEAAIHAIVEREKVLLEHSHAEVTLHAFCDSAREPLRALKTRIDAALSTHPSARQRATRARWGDYFDDAIGALTERQIAVSSETFQLREALLKSIDDWIALDAWLPPITLYEAQQALVEISDRAAFQPEGSDAPLQVVGLLEAAGVPFDAMWITGFSDAVLPEPTRLNAFLSPQWQRDARAGLASIDESEARAKRLVAGWETLCRDITVSLPAETSGEPQSWSPLASEWPLQKHDEHSLRESDSQFATCSLESVEDEHAGAWQLRADETHGTGAFESQALCPRLGFAAARLSLAAWPQSFVGLSPLQRGNLVHHVAEMLGRALMAEPNNFDALKRSLPEVVAAAIAESQRTLTHLPDVVWRAEAARLERVFVAAINADAARPPFEVEAVEARLTTKLGTIALSMRVDRLDRVSTVSADTGEVLREDFAVIDFKSGQVKRKTLLDDRLTAPQLPLYAHAVGFERIEAVAFARVHDDAQGFTGIGNVGSGFEPKRKPQGIESQLTWPEIKMRWLAQLESLANELIVGEAAVAPAYGIHTCQRCDFERFCRVDRRTLRMLESSLDADNGDDVERAL